MGVRSKFTMGVPPTIPPVPISAIQRVASPVGGLVGEANRQANRSKVYFGLQREPDISSFLAAAVQEVDDEDEAESDKAKKKKMRRDQASLKKQKNDPNAPPLNRIAFPDLRDSDKADKAKAWKEAQRRQNLSDQSLPSCCFYSVSLELPLIELHLTFD